jgi:hypothetical protein
MLGNDNGSGKRIAKLTVGVKLNVAGTLKVFSRNGVISGGVGTLAKTLSTAAGFEADCVIHKSGKISGGSGIEVCSALASDATDNGFRDGIKKSMEVCECISAFVARPDDDESDSKQRAERSFELENGRVGKVGEPCVELSKLSRNIVQLSESSIPVQRSHGLFVGSRSGAFPNSNVPSETPH